MADCERTGSTAHRFRRDGFPTIMRRAGTQGFQRSEGSLRTLGPLEPSVAAILQTPNKINPPAVGSTEIAESRFGAAPIGPERFHKQEPITIFTPPPSLEGEKI